MERLKFMYIIIFSLLLSGCLVERPPSDQSKPALELTFTNQPGRPKFQTPRHYSSFGNYRCVFAEENEILDIQLISTDGGGLLGTSLLVLRGEIVSYEITSPSDASLLTANVRTSGNNDTLTISFREVEGSSLNGVVVNVRVRGDLGLPYYIHAESTDVSLNTQEFNDTIRITDRSFIDLCRES